MTMSYVVIGMLGVSLALLAALYLQMRALRGAVDELSAVKSRSATVGGGADPSLREIVASLGAIERRTAGFDGVLSDVLGRLRTLNAVAPELTPDATVAAFPAAGPDTVAQEQPSENAIVEDDGQAPSPGPEPVADQDDGATPLDEVLSAYRRLIEHPRKNEINRWADELGGQGYEVAEDGSLYPSSRDAGGLLVLLPVDTGRAIIVPGGRLIVDFATSYSDVMAMRGVTRETFELIGDDTGILRLVEPAHAARNGEGWHLVRPGTLTGLKSG